MRGLIFFCLLALGAASAAAAQPAAARDCGAEHRSFEYMIGEWRVVQTASGKDFARNRVERIHGGCGVRENLRMSNGSLGTATTFFNPIEKLWHTFYHDSLGFYAHLTGITTAEGRQDLTADVRILSEGGRVRKARQVTSKDEAGRPRQIGYLLNDGDLSWQQFYDITFCPANQGRSERKPPC